MRPARRSVALLHLASGASILILMLIRIAVRLGYGAPPLPAGMPTAPEARRPSQPSRLLRGLILLPLTGATAIFFGIEDAADLHGTLVLLLFLLIAAHLGGVAFHTFIRRDGLLWRMLPAPADGAFGGRPG